MNQNTDWDTYMELTRKPTEILTREVKPNGLYGKTIKLYSYVVTMCRIDGSQVLAIREDHFQNKIDAMKDVEARYPNWKIKSVSRLYDEDFSE